MQVAVLGAKFGTVDIYNLPDTLKTDEERRDYVETFITTSDDTYIIAETITISDHRKTN